MTRSSLIDTCSDTAEPTEAAEVWALAILWSREEPERVGQVALLDTRMARADVFVLGRQPDPTDQPIRFVLQRPGRTTVASALADTGISRRQLELRPGPDSLTIQNVGRRSLLRRGESVVRVVADVGDVVEVRRRLVLMVLRRPAVLPPTDRRLHDFGEADEDGIVGESVAAWNLRRHVDFVAPRRPHVLVLGDSGAGKELVASAIHRRSGRRRHTMVSRNAATIPESLVDAELFGNVANYPNPGMPGREGLIGAADQSTLFLDEIAELPIELQSHLLRVLDQGGEYHRLGESTARRADVRLIGATNRPSSELRHDLLARIPLRVVVPGLDERPEDIPLLADFLLRRIGARDVDLRARFFDDDGRPNLAPALVAALAQHRYTHHVRELESLLWASLSSSTGSRLDLTEAVTEQIDLEHTEASPDELTPEAIQACLDRHNGVQARVWRELGLRNRHQLRRLIQKHDLRVGPDEAGS